MSDNSKDEGPLLLFDVLIEEYAHQAGSHQDLLPLEPEGKSQNHDEKVPYLYGEGVANVRQLVKEKYSSLPEDEDREQRINAELVKDFYQRLHKNGVKRTALCFSGGGIRSATFGLGVLQGLASHIDLNKFHYLSTVSGGGYLGSWFSAWVHRRGMDDVQKSLANCVSHESPLKSEPDPVYHLRRYSNYLSPRLGLLSADTWALVGIYLRNLFLNWMVLIPLLLVVLALPRLWISTLAWNKPPLAAVNLIVIVGIILGIISIGYVIVNRPSLADLTKNFPQMLRREGWFLVFGMGFQIAMATTSSLAWAWSHSPDTPSSPSLLGFEPQKCFNSGKPWGFILFGVLLLLLGFALSQFCAPQILRWRIYYRGIIDLVCSILTGILGGVFLWLMVQAYSKLGGSFGEGNFGMPFYACIAPPVFLLVFLAAATIFMGLASYYTSDNDREWAARSGGWVLIAIAIWLVVNGLVVFGPVGLIWLWSNFKIWLVSLGTGSGVISLLGGYSAKSTVKYKQGSQVKTANLAVRALEQVLPYAAVIFIGIIVATLSLGTTALTGLIFKWQGQGGEWAADWQKVASAMGGDWHINMLYFTPGALMLQITAVLLVIGVVMGLFINVNKFSLHSAYRDRLIRAYLGASRDANQRQQNPFTGMDEQDNLQLHELIRPVFHVDRFPKLGELVKEILNGQSDYSVFIRSNLTPAVRKLLESFQQSPPNVIEIENEVKQALADSFNQIVHGKPLHEEESFKLINKTPEILELIKKQPGVPLLTVNWLSRRLQYWQAASVEKLRINCLLLERAFPGLIEPVPEKLKEARPLHIINMALNLVKGQELAWQTRKAQSYTASPLHAGSYFRVGYRRVKEYAINRGQNSALTLGTSVAISGAAASPNCGYHSTPVVTFLLALFNVRLGWWLGNPGKAGCSTYPLPGPVFSPIPLLAETLGWTDNDSSYVYLSDGGHFENLGLYEMVLRRCHFIIVSDGSQDQNFDFESFGNAISKIRIDLGIRITFDSVPISPREENIPTYVKNINLENEKGKKYCAVGRIRYSDVDRGGPPTPDGYLLYIKPALYGIEPADVLNYARANRSFPHESTGDQMYSETQFESYRSLGLHEISKINETSKIKIAREGEQRPHTPPKMENLFICAYNHICEDVPADLLDCTKSRSHPKTG